MGEVIYGHDFKAKAEKERETMERRYPEALAAIMAGEYSDLPPLGDSKRAPSH